jgi:hypothetical protein
MTVNSNGLAFRNGVAANTATNEDVNREAYVQSDGQITLRSEETPRMRIYQIAELMANAYLITSQAYRLLGLGPRVHAQLEIKVDPQYRADSGELVFPSEYSDYFDFDLSRDEFADIAVDTLLLCLRSAGRSYARNDVRVIFEGLWQREYSGMVGRDLRNDWV